MGRGGVSVALQHPRNAPEMMAHCAKSLAWDDCVLLMLGFSLEFVQTALKEKKRLHIVCLDPTVKTGSVVGPNVQVFQNLWELGEGYPFMLARRYGTRLEALPATKALWPDLWEGLLEFCRRQAENMNSDIVTACRFAYEWQRNTLKNLRWIAGSGWIRQWFGQWRNPAILVSSGPSLDDNLGALRKIQNKAFILAVGSAAPRLKAAGINPGAVIAFDGGLANWQMHFNGLEMDCPLVFDPIIYHQIPTDWKGPKAIMQIWPFRYWSAAGCEVGLVEVGPSVANTAFDLLHRMGADPIVMAGQDLSYRGEKMHAKGTHLHRMGEMLTTARYDPKILPGVEGPVVGNTVFKTFLNTFEARIANAQAKRPFRLINSSFGAKIPGSEDVRLKDIDFGESKEDELQELRRKLIPPSSGAAGMADFLKRTLKAGEDLFDFAELRTYPQDLVSLELEPLAFVLQPVWNNSKCETDHEWACAETRAGLRFALPLLREAIGELEAA